MVIFHIVMFVYTRVPMNLPGGILTSRDPSSDLGYCRKIVSFLTPHCWELGRFAQASLQSGEPLPSWLSFKHEFAAGQPLPTPVSGSMLIYIYIYIIYIYIIYIIYNIYIYIIYNIYIYIIYIICIHYMICVHWSNYVYKYMCIIICI